MIERNLNTIQQELEERIVRGSDVIQHEKLKGDAKSENNYEIGCLLNELRGYYDSDELFGKACAQLWTEIVQRNPDRKIPSRNTSLNLRKLQDFGELHECDAVGHTNVYKLMEEKWEPLRLQVQEAIREVNMHDGEACKEMSKGVKQMCKEAFAAAKPQTFDEEEVRALVDRARKQTNPEERDALRMEGQAMAYRQLLDVDPDDFEDENELKAAIKQTIRQRERKYHPDRNLDNPERYEEEFRHIQQIKEFFNL